MAFVTIIIIIGVLLAFAEDKAIIKKGRLLSFVLIVVVFSLRYGYGNDFFSYQQFFYDITKYSSFVECVRQQPGEDVGWMAINYFLQPFGFQFILLISTFALCYIYYYLIDKYTPKPYKWVGILLFLMYPNLFLLDLSMIRQGLAGALFILSFSKGYENKWIQSIIICVIAISIHRVAFVCAPFVIMVNLKRYLNPDYIALCTLLVFAYVIFNPSFIERSFEQVLSSDLSSEYTSYFNRGGSESVLLGLFSRIIVITPNIIWFRKMKEFDKYLTLLFFISTFTILLSTQNYLLLRLECFFLPYMVLLFPRILCKECVFEHHPRRYNIVKPLMIIGSIGWIVFSVRSFFHFFSEPTYAKAYATFHTVLSLVF